VPLSVLVVGAGPGGVAAAVQLHRLGARVLWWDRTGVIGGLLRNARSVENWPGMPVGTSGAECCVRLREHAAAFGLLPETVEATGFSESGTAVEVVRPGGVTEQVDAVVWAMGTRPQPWAMARPELPVFYEFRDLPTAARRVLIVGGGEAACDGALHWMQSGGQAVLAVRSACLRARGRLAGQTLDRAGLDLRFDTEVIGLASDGTGVSATLRTAACSIAEPFDAVLFCGGRTSRLPELGFTTPPTGSLRLSARTWVIGDARLGSLGQACIAMGDGLLAASEISELIRWG